MIWIVIIMSVCVQTVIGMDELEDIEQPPSHINVNRGFLNHSKKEYEKQIECLDAIDDMRMLLQDQLKDINDYLCDQNITLNSQFALIKSLKEVILTMQLQLEAIKTRCENEHNDTNCLLETITTQLSQAFILAPRQDTAAPVLQFPDIKLQLEGISREIALLKQTINRANGIHPNRRKTTIVAKTGLVGIGLTLLYTYGLPALQHYLAKK